MDTRPRTFACPSCSAPLRAAGSAPTVVCPYCETTVLVPAALRPPPTYTPPPIYVPATAWGPVAAAAPDSTARVALVCAVLGLLFTCAFPGFGTILFIVALVLAGQYNRRQRQSPTPFAHPSNDSNVRAARIISWLGLGLTALLFLCIILSFIGGLAGLTLPGTPTPAFLP